MEKALKSKDVALENKHPHLYQVYRICCSCPWHFYRARNCINLNCMSEDTRRDHTSAHGLINSVTNWCEALH